MQSFNNNTEAFFALVGAGLWEKDVQLSSYGDIDFKEVYRLAEEQSVVGLVAAGIEHIVDIKIPKEDALQFVGQSLQLERQNTAMNHFIEVIVDKMRADGIYTLLVKGQGIAQCYQRPLWRSCGDVDLLLSEENYRKAESFLRPLASRVEEENITTRHIAMTIDAWEVELHGSLRGDLWPRLDKGVNAAQDAVFCEGKVRSWMNGKTQVFLPGANEDLVFVFSHILQHFFKEGIGLRQICDWCRLLWANKDMIDSTLLSKRLRAMGVMTEWKAFGAVAVSYLGMPAEAMPFYSENVQWKKKADKINRFVLETGNFGHNRDLGYHKDYTYIKKKAVSFKRHNRDAIRYFLMFPKDSIILWFKMIKEGVSYVIKGK